MRNFNNILIPIDFSDASVNALKYGVELAKINNSKVDMLHAYRLIDSNEVIRNDQVLNLKDKLKFTLERELLTLKSEHVDSNGINAMFHSIIGFPEDVIESFILNNKVDLIIMSTRGKGSNAFLFGNTFSATIKIINIPILAVPEHIHYRDWELALLSLSIPEEVSSILKQTQVQIETKHLQDKTPESILFKPNKMTDLLVMTNKDFERVENSLKDNFKSLNDRKIANPILIYN